MIKKKQYSERQIVVFSVIDVYHRILLFIVATEYEFQIMVEFSHCSLTTCTAGSTAMQIDPLLVAVCKVIFGFVGRSCFKLYAVCRLYIQGYGGHCFYWNQWTFRQCRQLPKNLHVKMTVPLRVWLPQIAKFMGPTWGPHGACRPQMGPMLAPWTLLSGKLNVVQA